MIAIELRIKLICDKKIKIDFSNTGFAHLISVTPMKKYIFGSRSTSYLGDFKAALIAHAVDGNCYATGQGSVLGAFIQEVFA